MLTSFHSEMDYFSDSVVNGTLKKILENGCRTALFRERVLKLIFFSSSF